MNKLKDEHLPYLNDNMYIPIQYKGTIAKQPFYSGDGNHSVKELEEICNQYKEYAHQQAVVKNNCMKHIVELKFNVDMQDNMNEL